jgi:hypothetical protein
MTSDGRMPDSAAVIVFPQDRKRWPNRPGLDGMQIYPDRYMRMSITDGRFEFLRLLPGEYFVAAVVDDGILGYPITPATTLNRLVRIATRVTVRESGLTNVKLQLP